MGAALGSGRKNGYQDMLGLGFAKGEMVAADLDFDRVTEGRGADKRHGRANKQTHFAETKESGAGFREFTDGGGSAYREDRERNWRWRGRRRRFGWS